MEKTVLFRNCLGVFQGGGCRAAAFAGAYEESIRRGVSFSEVAGTSAGAIVAALIGAGASPVFIREKLAELNFAELLSPPERAAQRGFLQRKFLPEAALDIYLDRGAYSSKGIKSWIERLLSDLLPSSERPIKFKSLPLPTFIVSTDLASSSAKVWSQETTPNDLVSDAVRASCSIPIFFQPVSNRHVDGALLSNLPSYVFSGGQQRPLASKILAFSLVSDELADCGSGGVFDYLMRLVSTVIDGGKHLQLELQPTVNLINIPTGAVQAADFRKMTPEITETLVANGKKATADFLDRERFKMKLNRNKENICYDKDGTLCRITEFSSQPLSRVVICENDTDWVYRLFPTILSLREMGTPIEVILPEGGDDEKHGPYRRGLLQALGVRLTTLPNKSTAPLRATIMLPNDSAHTRALIGVRKDPKVEADSMIYEGHLDEGVLGLTLEKMDLLIANHSQTQSAGPPTLIKVMDSDVLNPLRKLYQYSGSHVSLSIEEVRVDRLLATSRLTREFKYNQIKYLVDLYRKLGLRLFEPTAVLFANGMKSIVTPPVVEEVADGFVLIEGSTRATFCRDDGIQTFSCVVARGVREPLPSKLFKFENVRLTGKALPPNERYEGFSYDQFRHIERAVHPLDSFT
jgi:predicted acylesterase/phospholipase RssA